MTNRMFFLFSNYKICAGALQLKTTIDMCKFSRQANCERTGNVPHKSASSSSSTSHARTPKHLSNVTLILISTFFLFRLTFDFVILCLSETQTNSQKYWPNLFSSFSTPFSCLFGVQRSHIKTKKKIFFFGDAGTFDCDSIISPESKKRKNSISAPAFVNVVGLIMLIKFSGHQARRTRRWWSWKGAKCEESSPQTHTHYDNDYRGITRRDGNVKWKSKITFWN